MIRAKMRFVDRECSAPKRLGLGKSVGLLKQLSQIIKSFGHDRMIRIEAFLIDSKRATQQRLGVRIMVRDLK